MFNLTWACINIINKFGEIPLLEACQNGNLAVIKYLIENGADINKARDDG